MMEAQRCRVGMCSRGVEVVQRCRGAEVAKMCREEGTEGRQRRCRNGDAEVQKCRGTDMMVVLSC